MRRATAIGAAIGALVHAGCGPAPYTIGPEEPVSPAPAPGVPAVVVVTPEARPAAPPAEPEVGSPGTELEFAL